MNPMIREAMLKWAEERRQGMHRGRTPTPEHAASIWDTSFIPDRYCPATDQLIAEAEARVEISIPASMRAQLLIQNGGQLCDCDPLPFGEKALWMNAAVDGILQVQQWDRAAENNWFESVDDVPDLYLLVRIAAHSESQLCLDFRKSGSTGTPAVTYIDVCMDPTEVVVLAETVDDFIQALIVARRASETS